MLHITESNKNENIISYIHVVKFTSVIEMNIKTNTKIQIKVTSSKVIAWVQINLLNDLSMFSDQHNQLNSLSPNSDQHQISPCNISSYSTPEVMRIKDMITQGELS